MRNMEKRWIEPEAYEISREEYAKDKVVRDVYEPTTKMMTIGDCLLALQRLTNREREKAEKVASMTHSRRHTMTAEFYEAVMFYLRAKNEIIRKMKD
jgi:hypothetical protein